MIWQRFAAFGVHERACWMPYAALGRAMRIRVQRFAHRILASTAVGSAKGLHSRACGLLQTTRVAPVVLQIPPVFPQPCCFS
jgi:hypothetical protein